EILVHLLASKLVIPKRPFLRKCNHCTILAMPVIQRFHTCVIRINLRDHLPPPFHIAMNDGREVWVRIDTLQIIHGKVPARELAEALAWASQNRLLLMQKFEEYWR